MIKFGEQGTEPLLEALDVIISDWMDDGLIMLDGHAVVVVVNDADGRINIILHDGSLNDGPDDGLLVDR